MGKKHGHDFFNFLKDLISSKNINYPEEEYADMPYLETEEEAAANIADIHESKNNTRKKQTITAFNKYGIDVNGIDRDGYNINGINEYGVDRDGYNINGINEYGVDRDGYNINGIKGTRKRYPKKNPDYKEDDNGVLYDRYGFDSTGFDKDGYGIYGFDKDGFNKDGYDIDGFDKDGLNKDGSNKYGYKNQEKV